MALEEKVELTFVGLHLRQLGKGQTLLTETEKLFSTKQAIESFYRGANFLSKGNLYIAEKCLAKCLRKPLSMLKHWKF